jgi:hypothetical protein
VAASGGAREFGPASRTHVLRAGAHTMKTRLLIEVGDHERYVIARYFGAAAVHVRDKKRPRATRAQVKRFVEAALRTAVKEQADRLRSRARATARRLAEGRPVPEAETLPEPAEKQDSLW